MQYVVAIVLLLAALVLLRELAQMFSGLSSGLGDAFSSPGHVLGLVAISLAIVGVIMLVFYETTVHLKRQRYQPPAPWTPGAVPAEPAPREPDVPSETPVEAEERLLGSADPPSATPAHHPVPEPVAEPAPAALDTPEAIEEAVAAGEAVLEPPPLFAPRITEVPTSAPLPRRTPAANGAANGSAAVNGNGAANGRPAANGNGSANGSPAANGSGVGSRAVDLGDGNGGGEGKQSSDWLANARLLIAPDPVREEPFPRVLEESDRCRVSLYSFTVRIPKVDLEARLGSPEVRQAARGLAAEPDSDNLRLALVTALTSDSDNLFLNEASVVLRVTTVRASGGPVRDRLDELVLVTLDGKLGHRVRAIDPSPDARLLITGNPRLACALVNAAFPVQGADTAVLDQRLLGTVDALDLDGSVRRKPTAAGDGTPLEIDSLSGASVGSRSIAS